MTELTVYRVSFSGDWLAIESARELGSRDVWLEGSTRGPGRPSRHWGLVYAHSREEAIRLVRDGVSPHGGFCDFAVEPVLDSQGKPWRGEFHRRWDEIDWDAVQRRVALSEIHAAAMYALADAAEPTELVRREVGLPRPTVEKALRELCEKGLAEHFVLPFFYGDYDKEDEDWWGLTHEAWDLLASSSPCATTSANLPDAAQDLTPDWGSRVTSRDPWARGLVCSSTPPPLRVNGVEDQTSQGGEVVGKDGSR